MEQEVKYDERNQKYLKNIAEKNAAKNKKLKIKNKNSSRKTVPEYIIFSFLNCAKKCSKQDVATFQS